MNEKPFAITLDVGTSLANKTGSWRTERPVYVHNLPPCNQGCPAGENIQQWLFEAERGEITRVAKIRRRVPVDAYLRPQKRFAHLFGSPGHPEMVAHIQANADRNIRRFKLLDEAEA